jgi:hypothetical protein
VLRLSLRERSASVIVTAFDSANAFVWTDREPAMRRVRTVIGKEFRHGILCRRNCRSLCSR